MQCYAVVPLARRVALELLGPGHERRHTRWRDRFIVQQTIFAFAYVVQTRLMLSGTAGAERSVSQLVGHRHAIDRPLDHIRVSCLDRRSNEAVCTTCT